LYRKKLLPHLTDAELEEYLRNKYENELLSISNIAQACGIDYRTVHKYLDKFGIKKRTKSEGMHLRFDKMTDEEKKDHTKKAVEAIKEKEWTEEERHKMARSRVRVKMSTYEKWFAKELIDNDLYYFMFSYPIGRYSADFAFPTIKLTIEVDSEWHRKADIVDKDERKERYLKAEGWDTLRLRVHNNKNLVEDTSAIIAKLKERL
jgi:very-short-patch-repair endonuclease